MTNKKDKVEESTEKLDTSKLNIYQKLAGIRKDFYASAVKKTGKNSHAEFMYYELDDIVPVCNEIIINKYNCIFIVNFLEDRAIGSLINLDNISDLIVFSKTTHEIIEPSKYRMNEIQADGSLITYYRRYLYFLLLDIATPDQIDNDVEKVETKKEKKAEDKKPATPEKRKEIVKEIVKDEPMATEFEIKALKNACKKLKELDPSQEKFIADIAKKTKKFTEIKSTGYKKLMEKINNMIEVLGSAQELEGNKK